jgi:hypothetical protein
MKVRIKSYPTRHCLVGYDLNLTWGCLRFNNLHLSLSLTLLFTLFYRVNACFFWENRNSYPRMSQNLLSCTSPGVRPYISLQKWNSYALFSQDKDAHIGYSPNLENRLWNKVNSNFDPAYFLLVIRCFEYFSPHFSPAFIRFHHRVSMNGEMTNVILLPQ